MLLSNVLSSSTFRGSPGFTPTLTLGAVTAVNPNVSPTITNTGTNGNAIFNFNIPNAASLSFSSLTTVTPNINPSVSTTTTNGNVTFGLSIPRAAAVTVSPATVINPNVSPSVNSVTTNGDVDITFSLPAAASVTLGALTSLNPDQIVTLTNSGINGNAVLNFGIPRAAAVSLNATPVVTVNPNVNPSLANSGTNGDAVLQFSIPRAASVSLNATPVVTVNPNVNPSLANSGTNGDAVLQFSIPRASAISVGSVTTLEPLVPATVVNVGTNGDTVLNFSIPRGLRGVIPRGAWNSATSYALDDLATYQGTTYRRIVAGTTGGIPLIDATNWEVFAASGGGLTAQTSYVVDNISNHFNGTKTLFNLNVNGASAGVTQAQDLMVVINGNILSPDIQTASFSTLWLSLIPSGGLGADYKIINNKLLLYSPPQRGWESYILYTPTQTVTYTAAQYPFSALAITLGD